MSMAKEIIYTARVEFGDCDPAGIVWFPNFFRWIDAASRHFLPNAACRAGKKRPRRWA